MLHHPFTLTPSLTSRRLSASYPTPEKKSPEAARYPATSIPGIYHRWSRHHVLSLEFQVAVYNVSHSPLLLCFLSLSASSAFSPSLPLLLPNMKFSLTALLTLALAVTAIPTQDRANKTHDGTKVIRVAIPDSAESAARLQTLVGKLDLPLWSRNFLPNGVVDVQVPKEKIEAFEAASIEWKKDVMFEDLGKSIREEADGIADEGMITISAGELISLAGGVRWVEYRC